MKKFFKDAISSAAKAMFMILFSVGIVLIAVFPVFIGIATEEPNWAWLCAISAPMAIGVCVATIEYIERRW